MPSSDEPADELGELRRSLHGMWAGAAPEHWWRRTSALAGPVAQILAGLEFPGLSLVATARRPT